MLGELAGILAIAGTFAIPVVAIVMGLVAAMRRNNNQRILREKLIESKADMEFARLMLEEQKKPEEGTIRYSTLRWGMTLLGAGLGAIISYQFSMVVNVWMISTMLGAGVGLLAAFATEWKLKNRK